MPGTDEFSATLEHEVRANWAVRASGIYSRNFNQYRTVEVDRPASVYTVPITNNGSRSRWAGRLIR